MEITVNAFTMENRGALHRYPLSVIPASSRPPTAKVNVVSQPDSLSFVVWVGRSVALVAFSELKLEGGQKVPGLQNLRLSLQLNGFMPQAPLASPGINTALWRGA